MIRKRKLKSGYAFQVRLNKKGISHCGKKDCKYCPPLTDLKPHEPRSMSPALSVARPSDHGFTRRKYVFKGYMSEDNAYIEVKPNPMTHEPRFKNKIEEYIHIAKQSKL